MRSGVGTSYSASVFLATHNSYSGGERGSIRKQLEGGVRVLELDFVDASYRRHGYRLGHGLPNREVMKGKGNPDDLKLESWLDAIASWCSGHPGHDPVTIILDPKNDLTDPDSFAGGNLAALNAVVEDAFGDRLYRADALGDDEAWPSVSDLAGRVILVLSGRVESRRGYVGDGGLEPAVAIDGRGRVVEVHHSSRLGQVWYWSGERADERVTWRRHGRIGDGRSPAVAIAGDGTIVTVHRDGGDLFYRLGSFEDGTLEVRWQTARKAAPEVSSSPSPTVRMLDAHRLRITYETDHGRRAREGRLAGDKVTWDSAGPMPARPGDAAWSASHARNGSAEVTVLAVPDRIYDPQLLYGTEGLDAAPIAYEQLLFVEGQWVPADGKDDIAHGRRFVATAASPSAEKQMKDWTRRRKVVRLWGFNEADAAARSAPNFPATDHPDAPWYRAFCKKFGARPA